MPTTTEDLLNQIKPSELDLQTTHHMLVIMAQQLNTLTANQQQMLDVLNGSTSRDLPGLRARMREAEASIDEWKRYKLVVKGVAIGMGLTMLTSISTLITLVAQALKVSP